MVLVESLLGNGRNESPTNYNHLASHPDPSTDPSRLNLVHVPGHELYARVLECLAGLVVHGDPTHDVDQVALLGRNDVVVGLPAHPASDVGKLGGKFSGFVGGEQPL